MAQKLIQINSGANIGFKIIYRKIIILTEKSVLWVCFHKAFLLFIETERIFNIKFSDEVIMNKKIITFNSLLKCINDESIISLNINDSTK